MRWKPRSSRVAEAVRYLEAGKARAKVAVTI